FSQPTRVLLKQAWAVKFQCPRALLAVPAEALLQLRGWSCPGAEAAPASESSCARRGGSSSCGSAAGSPADTPACAPALLPDRRPVGKPRSAVEQSPWSGGQKILSLGLRVEG